MNIWEKPLSFHFSFRKHEFGCKKSGHTGADTGVQSFADVRNQLLNLDACPKSAMWFGCPQCCFSILFSKPPLHDLNLLLRNARLWSRAPFLSRPRCRPKSMVMGIYFPDKINSQSHVARITSRNIHEAGEIPKICDRGTHTNPQRQRLIMIMIIIHDYNDINQRVCTRRLNLRQLIDNREH